MGKPKIIKYCDYCKGSRCRKNNKFCTRQCAINHKHLEWVKRWLKGLEDGIRAGVLTSKHIRRFLKEVRGEKCEICDWAERNPSTKLIPLHLDHIDGDYRNNRSENVRLICPNCHALTCNYGGANRGHGRPFGVYKRIAE